METGVVGIVDAGAAALARIRVAAALPQLAVLSAPEFITLALVPGESEVVMREEPSRLSGIDLYDRSLSLKRAGYLPA